MQWKCLFYNNISQNVDIFSIIHIMSKQKVWNSIFIKDVYKTDYVLELCYV